MSELFRPIDLRDPETDIDLRSRLKQLDLLTSLKLMAGFSIFFLAYDVCIVSFSKDKIVLAKLGLVVCTGLVELIYIKLIKIILIKNKGKIIFLIKFLDGRYFIV